MTNLLNFANGLILFGGAIGIIFVFVILYVLGLRRIVKADQVHVVQRNNTSDVYGSSAKDNKGNTYYEFPEWLPRLGVTVKKLSTAIFDVNLTEYDAYDKDRLPFLVDIKAFFRITLAIIMNIFEYIVRFIWLMLPLGFHVFMLQMRDKVDRLPAINGYFDENSTWSMIYDGVVLVSTTPGSLAKRFQSIGDWFVKTRYFWIILAVFMLLGLLAVIAYKLH